VGPVAAVALGATVVEKHFTIDNRLPGPDHAFALEPEELTAMVRAIRAAERVLGDGVKTVGSHETELRSFAVRAVQATRDLAPGDPLVEGDNIDVLRPGKRSVGMHPRHLDALQGRRAARHIAAGEGVRPDDVLPPIIDA
jgi:N-acetylneuraminate synthase